VSRMVAGHVARLQTPGLTTLREMTLRPERS